MEHFRYYRYSVSYYFIFCFLIQLIIVNLFIRKIDLEEMSVFDIVGVALLFIRFLFVNAIIIKKIK